MKLKIDEIELGVIVCGVGLLTVEQLVSGWICLSAA